MYTRTLIGSVLFLLYSGAVYAEMEPDEIIKYRGRVMEAAKNHSGAAGQIVNGQIELKKHLLGHARALNDILADVPSLFPEGSDFGETDAKAEIWKNAEEFAKASKDSADKAAAFLKAVESGDDGTIRSSYDALGDSCKSCHKKFRAKK